MQRKKPTVKQLGNFVLSVYDKMRQIERIAMGNSQAFLQYLEMTGELDKFNDYLKEKVDQNDAEKTKEHKKGIQIFDPYFPYAKQIFDELGLEVADPNENRKKGDG